MTLSGCAKKAHSALRYAFIRTRSSTVKKSITT